jgi:hypothetical protein
MFLIRTEDTPMEALTHHPGDHMRNEQIDRTSRLEGTRLMAEAAEDWANSHIPLTIPRVPSVDMESVERVVAMLREI